MVTKFMDMARMFVEKHEGSAVANNDFNLDGTGVTTTDTTLTDPTKAWTTDQWVGSIVLAATSTKTMTVTSNTADTLTGTGGWSGGGNPGSNASWYIGTFYGASNLIDTRDFTPGGALDYWAGATVYAGLSRATITGSGKCTLGLGGWSTGIPANGTEYSIIRDRGSQYRYANQVYNCRTTTDTETVLWEMPTLSLPDSVNGAVAFIKADITATAAGTPIAIDPTIARWHKEGTFKWLHTGWQANAASFVDVGVNRTYKEAASALWDCSLRLRTSDFYPVLYVTGPGAATTTDWQATVEFTAYSIVA